VFTPVSNRQLAIANRQLLGFLVARVLAATAAEFAEFQPVRRRFLVLGRNVITTLTVLTLKYDIVAWHN